MNGNPRAALILQLQRAYSGEAAAAYAYRGHHASVRDVAERDEIRRIEKEEWHHRALIGDMLAALGSRPTPAREFRMGLIGRVLGALCHVSGWFLPMYGAGRLERQNIQEYLDAAAYALAADHPELVDSLLRMAETEWDHERYFRDKVRGHFLGRIAPMWPEPPPRESLRSLLPAG
ncbi:MAG: hypothetical protein FJX76_05040 [Armatimonadetes bacterium]|nr:hypothetical protein [Armatimonadota bacterium]